MSLEFKSITHGFGDKKILKNLSFQVPTGQRAFLLGRSGTGKSVTLKLLMGLYDPDEGEVEIEGERISHTLETSKARLRRICGMVFQNPALIDSLSVAENITFGLIPLRLSGGEIERRTLDSLARVHLGKEILGALPRSLSFGMQKRVSIARALALKPRHLLFDEPTTGLDPISTHAVMSLIEELSRDLGVTCFVVSHDMRSALKTAQTILFLDNGALCASGSPEAMRKSNHPLVKAFFEEAISEEESS